MTASPQRLPDTKDEALAILRARYPDDADWDNLCIVAWDQGWLDDDWIYAAADPDPDPGGTLAALVKAHKSHKPPKP